MKYLNLGCGYHYSNKEEWVNLDFISTGDGVLAHNLLEGIPFGANEFDMVYHSHVLEHFTKPDGVQLIKECFRVLKPGGIIRIAIPDLEQIARLYLRFLERGIEDPNDEYIRANYEWMLMEMYDQTVRNFSGGAMADYLKKEEMINEDFVYERIGEEGKAIRTMFRGQKNKIWMPALNQSMTIEKAIKGVFRRLKEKRAIKSIVERTIQQLWPTRDLEYQQIGIFRSGGEIHQWMYDRYSLNHLLIQSGFEQVIVRDAFSSFLSNWAEYEIDQTQSSVRKPDSLFMEAKKKAL